MEIYNNGTTAERTVTLDVPVTPDSGSMTVTIIKDGLIVHTFNTVTAVPGGFSVVIPYFLVQHDSEFVIRWEFSYTEDGQQYDFDKSKTVEVVTPLLTPKEILEIHPNATPYEVSRIEKAVRHVINAHTGQAFGKKEATYTVRGGNGHSLILPQRLVALSSVDGIEPGQFYEVAGDGWYLNYYPQGVPPVRADYYGLHEHRGGVIHNPNNVSLGQWRNSMRYTIRGMWGWENVPEQVKEAARLLVNDYACADQAYRDRYLTSMTAADWRIQFNSGAFSKTGNVRADQLLATYVLKRDWAVV